MHIQGIMVSIWGKDEPAFLSPEEKRAKAVETAMKAMGIELTYTNHYECAVCEVEWTDEWSCAVDDDCPTCGVPTSPYDWETNIDLEGDSE